MTVESAVRLRLLQISAVTALVGTKVFAGESPQDHPGPLIKAWLVDESQPSHMRGGVTFFRSRVQVDTMVSQSASADPHAAAAAIDAALHGPGDGTGLCGYEGSVGSPAFEITGILPIEGSVRRTRDASAERKAWMFSRDYWVYHKG